MTTDSRFWVCHVHSSIPPYGVFRKHWRVTDVVMLISDGVRLHDLLRRHRHAGCWCWWLTAYFVLFPAASNAAFPVIPRCAPYISAGPASSTICYAPNYWKWLPEILRHEGSQVVMLTIWIKWLRGCISSFSADISGRGARTTVGTRIKGDPLSKANWARREGLDWPKRQLS